MFLTVGQSLCVHNRSVEIAGRHNQERNLLFAQHAFVCFIISLRTWKESLVQECRLYEPALQGQVAVQRVLQRPALLQEQSAWISCVSSNSSTYTENRNKAIMVFILSKYGFLVCTYLYIFLHRWFEPFVIQWLDENRGSVSGLSARCFGERQKRWGKSFQLFFSLSPLHSSGSAESLLLFRQNYCNPSFVLPLSHSKPKFHPPCRSASHTSAEPVLHSSKATIGARTQQHRCGLKAERIFGLRGCFSQSASLYKATLWRFKEAWLRRACT